MHPIGGQARPPPLDPNPLANGCAESFREMVTAAIGHRPVFSDSPRWIGGVRRQHQGMTQPQAWCTTRRRCRAWVRIFMWFAVLGHAGTASRAQEKSASAAARAFDIPADTADKTLKQFAAQSGLEVAFGTATTSAVRTNAVKGNLTPREAVETMLAGTGL